MPDLRVDDGRIQRGNEARRAVLDLAVQIASVEGLDGLSLGRLAGELQVSKSGVFALFGSKEDLQLATIEAAKAVFVEAVVAPALTVDQGRARVQALCESWLRYSRNRVFSGGCFFARANAEFGARPGRIRDELATAQTEWSALVTSVVERALASTGAAAGRAAGADEADQVAFELIAVMEAANAQSVLHDDQSGYDRALASCGRILAAEFGQ